MLGSFFVRCFDTQLLSHIKLLSGKITIRKYVRKKSEKVNTIKLKLLQIHWGCASVFFLLF